ncbi:uncharacterized protein LOC141914724 [Tubulanus polymorphus]|uniref:uncharacterized protein LOC141914724 n=1 Tax=Tubulanus polymorphus TaxID=672921 RepID=UPI003DA65C72
MKTVFELDDLHGLKALAEREIKELGIELPKNKKSKGVQKSQSQEKANQSAIFGNPLLNVPSAYVYGYGYVPRFLVEAAAYIDEHITSEGIFRKAGSHSRQKELRQTIDNGGHLSQVRLVDDVANLVKQFFRELPEPLITNTLHSTFLQCLELEDDLHVEAVLLLCLTLPIEHLSALRFIFNLLSNVVANCDRNKMDAANLAKVITPNIMRNHARTDKAAPFDEKLLDAETKVIRLLIENADEIGCVQGSTLEKMNMMSSLAGFSGDELCSDSLADCKQRKKKRRSGSLQGMINSINSSLSKWRNKTTSSSSITSSKSDISVKSDQSLSNNLPTAAPIVRKRKAGEEIPFSLSKKKAILKQLPQQSVMANFTPAANKGKSGDDPLTPTIAFVSPDSPMQFTALPSSDQKMSSAKKKRFPSPFRKKNKRYSSGKISCSPRSKRNIFRRSSGKNSAPSTPTSTGGSSILSGNSEDSSLSGSDAGSFSRSRSRLKKRMGSFFKKHKKTPSSPGSSFMGLPIIRRARSQGVMGVDNECVKMVDMQMLDSHHRANGLCHADKLSMPDAMINRSEAVENRNPHKRAFSADSSLPRGALRRGKPNSERSGLVRRSIERPIQTSGSSIDSNEDAVRLEINVQLATPESEKSKSDKNASPCGSELSSISAQSSQPTNVSPANHSLVSCSQESTVSGHPIRTSSPKDAVHSSEAVAEICDSESIVSHSTSKLLPHYVSSSNAGNSDEQCGAVAMDTETANSDSKSADTSGLAALVMNPVLTKPILTSLTPESSLSKLVSECVESENCINLLKTVCNSEIDSVKNVDSSELREKCAKIENPSELRVLRSGRRREREPREKRVAASHSSSKEARARRNHESKESKKNTESREYKKENVEISSTNDSQAIKSNTDSMMSQVKETIVSTREQIKRSQTLRSKTRSAAIARRPSIKEPKLQISSETQKLLSGAGYMNSRPPTPVQSETDSIDVVIVHPPSPKKKLFANVASFDKATNESVMNLQAAGHVKENINVFSQRSKSSDNNDVSERLSARPNITRKRGISPVRIPTIFAKSTEEAAAYREKLKNIKKNSPTPNRTDAQARAKANLPINTCLLRSIAASHQSKFNIVNEDGESKENVQPSNPCAKRPNYDELMKLCTPVKPVARLPPNTNCSSRQESGLRDLSNIQQNMSIMPLMPKMKQVALASDITQSLLSRKLGTKHAALKNFRLREVTSKRTGSPMKPLKRLHSPHNSPRLLFQKSPRKFPTSPVRPVFQRKCLGNSPIPTQVKEDLSLY